MHDIIQMQWIFVGNACIFIQGHISLNAILGWYLLFRKIRPLYPFTYNHSDIENKLEFSCSAESRLVVDCGMGLLWLVLPVLMWDWNRVDLTRVRCREPRPPCWVGLGRATGEPGMPTPRRQQVVQVGFPPPHHPSCTRDRRKPVALATLHIAMETGACRE